MPCTLWESAEPYQNVRTSEFESTEESIRSGAQTAEIASRPAQNKINTHLNSDTSPNSSHKTTPSKSKLEASGELENKNEDNFKGQEYDLVGPIDKMTESCHLSSLATSEVQTDEHSMHITYSVPASVCTPWSLYTPIGKLYQYTPK